MSLAVLRNDRCEQQSLWAILYIPEKYNTIECIYIYIFQKNNTYMYTQHSWPMLPFQSKQRHLFSTATFPRLRSVPQAAQLSDSCAGSSGLHQFSSF